MVLKRKTKFTNAINNQNSDLTNDMIIDYYTHKIIKLLL